MSKRPKRTAKRPTRPDQPAAKSDAAPGQGGSPPTLAGLRRELDAVDQEILAAINRRGEIAQQIGRAKQAENAPVYDAARESDVLERATSNSAGPLSPDAVQAIFRELISGT